MSETILVLPSDTGQHVLDTDASDRGGGELEDHPAKYPTPDEQDTLK